MKKRKLNLQLILLTLCIAVPAVAIFAFFSIRNNRMQRGELLAERQAALQEEVAQLDSYLEMLEHALAYLTVDDIRIQQIAQATEQDTQFWIDNNSLRQRLQSQTALINGLNFTPFIYFPEQDIFYNAQEDPLASEQLRKMMDVPRTDSEIMVSSQESVTGSWSRMDGEGRSYLYILMQSPDFTIGAWLPLESLISGILQNDQEQVLVADLQGTIRNMPTTFSVDVQTELLSSDGKLWYIVTAPSTQGEFRLIRLIAKSSLDAQLSSVGANVLIMAGIFALLLLVYLFFLNVWILKPVRHLRTGMEVIRNGDLEHRITPPDSASEEFCSMAEEFNHLMDSIEQLKISIYESELEQQEVRLAYLSRQIQPHFILNSLNTLYNHSDDDARTTKEIVKLISSYYRYVVNVNSSFVMLGQELEHIDHYLRLQNIRYPNLFTYEILCDETYRGMQVPPFIVESFVGNIFKHGFIPGTPNVIRICVESAPEQEQHFLVHIEDNGEGFSRDSLDSIRDYLEDGIVSEELGVGIRNSMERLQLIYKEQCSIRIYNKPDHGAVVEIVFPESMSDTPLTTVTT